MMKKKKKIEISNKCPFNSHHIYSFKSSSSSSFFSAYIYIFYSINKKTKKRRRALLVKMDLDIYVAAFNNY